MPHKRSKRSVREADRASKGYNLPPSARDDDTPRGAMRIFNAAKVQASFRASGRTNSEDTGERRGPPPGKGKGKGKGDNTAEGKGEAKSKGKKRAREDDAPGGKKALKTADGKALPRIGQHESLGEYNRRIEALLRPGVGAAIKSAEAAKGQRKRAAAEEKKARIARAQGKLDAEAEADSDRDEAPPAPIKEFATAPVRRRLNDVAEAPPQLPRIRVAKTDTTSAWGATGRTPLSAAQKRILEEERVRVVGLYREMKAKREAERELEREGGKKK